jgi:carboxymethylenebutenolidase
MLVATEFVDLPAEMAPMRTMIVRPTAAGTYPGLVLYSDIFQLTASTQRAMARFASYGFVVAAPEIYHRFEPAGRALDFSADYQHAQDDAKKLHLREVDADLRVLLDYLTRDPAVGGKPLFAGGWCLGGHFAFRAALQPQIRATVCFYPTDLETGDCVGDTEVDTLARSAEIRGEILIVFGDADPHVDLAGRRKIEDALIAAKVRHLVTLYPGQHAFMRDEGPRYDAAESDRAMVQALEFFRTRI